MLYNKLIAPGIIHIALGGTDEAWIINDGTFEVDAVADLAPPADAEALKALLTRSGLSTNPFKLNVSVMLLRWRGQLVLIDAGCGAAYGTNLGSLAKRLKEINVAPTEIAAVLFTHLHPDHITGAIDAQTNEVAFPNARFFAYRAEAEFWKADQPDLSRARIDQKRREMVLGMVKKGLVVLAPKLEVFNVGDEPWPGLPSIPLFGHTPHQVGFVIRGEAGTLINAGDALLDPTIHVQRLEWTLASDTLPQAQAETRRGLFELAIKENAAIFGAHFANPGFGYILPKGDGFVYEAARWFYA